MTYYLTSLYSNMAVVVLLLLYVGLGLSQPIAHAPQGPVQGYMRDSPDGKPTTVFLGVPYATPPLGDLRFRRPTPHPVWTEPFLATQYGDACAQDIRLSRSVMPSEEFYQRYIVSLTYSEDCLNLNIFYPGEFTGMDDPLPVMVWIHGGGFNAGSGFRMTDGDMLAQETRVLIVSIHYRLGAFGFLATGHPMYSGNAGLYDQRLALRWVQDNIRAFGGDPNAVTIFGESAGALSVSAHMVSEGSAGLFHQAIGQSGSLTNFSPMSRETVTNTTIALMDRLGCYSADMETAVGCLRSKQTEDIVRESMELLALGHQFHTCTDNQFIPEDYLERIRLGDISKVPSIWGTNPLEAGPLFMTFFGDNPLNRGLTRHETEGLVTIVASSYNNPEPVYDELVAFYFPESMEDVWRNLEGANRMFSDWTFEGPKGYKLDALSRQDVDNVYEYYFLPR